MSKQVAQLQAAIKSTQEYLDVLHGRLADAIANPGYVVGSTYHDPMVYKGLDWTVLHVHEGNAWAVSPIGTYGVLLAKLRDRYHEV